MLLKLKLVNSTGMLILCTMLISLFRPDVLLSVLPTKPIRIGLLACLPASLLILTDPPFSFLVKGLFFASDLFSLIDVRSFLLLAWFSLLFLLKQTTDQEVCHRAVFFSNNMI